jgi:hypothetical protein
MEKCERCHVEVVKGKLVVKRWSRGLGLIYNGPGLCRVCSDDLDRALQEKLRQIRESYFNSPLPNKTTEERA